MATLSLALRSLAGKDLLVGFSGGLDSTTLLHALAGRSNALDCRVRAIHVDHGLHPDSGDWADHCAEFCASLGIELQVERTRVALDQGRGLEAAAREARHVAFLRNLRRGESLVLAHHRGDQAETVLLRLLRASASGGLGAMRAATTLDAHPVLRPLLDVERAELLACAEAAGLNWLEDPSNAELSLDRNYLRHRLMPVLRQRWPQADAALARSAALLAEDAELLAEVSAGHLSRLRHPGSGAVDVETLLELRPAWRSRVLRRWVEEAGLPPLPGKAIGVIEANLLAARPDSLARYLWHGVAMRRWRGQLYLEQGAPVLPADWQSPWDGRRPLLLPTGETLALLADIDGATPVAASPTAADIDDVLAGLQVRTRRGGERITLTGRRHSHSLKHCLQVAKVPPWRRERLPLLVAADGEVLAAGDAVVSARLAGCCKQRGIRLQLLPAGSDPD